MSIYLKLTNLDSRVVTLENQAGSAILSATTASNFSVTNALSASQITASTLSVNNGSGTATISYLTASNLSASAGLANLTTLSASNFSASAGLANLATLTASNINVTNLTSSAINLGDETLSTYNEGTWSPTYTGFNGTTPTTTRATYTQIGRMVYFEIDINTSPGSLTSSLGSSYITLPVTQQFNSIGAFYDRSDSTDYGNCVLAGGKAYTPAFTIASGKNLLLSGFYQASTS